MRIAYIVHWDVDRETGVLKKIREQMSAWIALGHEVRLFALAKSREVWGEMAPLSTHVVANSGAWTRGRRMAELVAAVDDWAPDLAYVRFSTYFSALESLLRRTPAVLELNTDDLREYRLYLSRAKYLYHLATRKRILTRAQGLVCVTAEIAERYRKYGKPAAVIANGIDLASFRPLPPASNPRVRAVFVGSPDSAWHGVDKILTLAEQLGDWHFDLVGPTLEPVPANVTAHGPLGRVEYERILASADLAIGTLAMHRNEMDEACPLKTREYLALGIPCIIGYRDTDFDEPVPYLLELPNTPGNITDHLAAIREFGERVRGTRVEQRAVEHLDVKRKEKRRVCFFEEVLRQHSGAAGEGGHPAPRRVRTA